MRLWSLAPKYLDRQGLLAVWREGLLAQKVLAGKTAGYRHHPQLARFRETTDPLAYIGAYLSGLADEAAKRQYNFNREKIVLLKKNLKKIKVNNGQLRYEFQHLLNKLKDRDPALFRRLAKVRQIEPHQLFVIREGKIESWEKI